MCRIYNAFNRIQQPRTGTNNNQFAHADGYGPIGDRFTVPSRMRLGAAAWVSPRCERKAPSWTRLPHHFPMFSNSSLCPLFNNNSGSWTGILAAGGGFRHSFGGNGDSRPIRPCYAPFLRRNLPRRLCQASPLFNRSSSVGYSAYRDTRMLPSKLRARYQIANQYLFDLAAIFCTIATRSSVHRFGRYWRMAA
jgi:hypothetical protein